MVNGFSNSDDSKEKNERLKEVFTENSDMKRLMKVKEAQLNDLQARLEDKERELENKCKEMKERDGEIEYLKERVEKQNAELKKTKTLEELKEMVGQYDLLCYYVNIFSGATERATIREDHILITRKS